MATILEIVARQPVISSHSRGPIVNLVGWIAMVVMILAVLTVLVSKYIMLRHLGWNDLLITFAMLFSIGQTVATSEQVSNGLGRNLKTISAAEYINFQKAGYAANLLYIAAICAAKISTLALLHALTRMDGHRRPIQAVGLVVLLWAVAVIFASAFQCNLPHAWAYETGKCFNQLAFWDAVGALDIVTDIAIMTLPIVVVRNLQLSFAKKIAVCSAFSARFLAIAFTVFRLATLPQSLRKNPSLTNASATGSNDLTMNSYLVAIATLLESFAAIFSTCVPHLRPFMESLQSGFLSGVIDESAHEGRTAYGNGYAMDKLGSRVTVRSNRDPLASVLSNRGDKPVVLKNENGQILVEKPANVPIGLAVGTDEVVAPGHLNLRARRNSAGSDGAGSHGSHGSGAMIIKQTKEWSVRYEE